VYRAPKGSTTYARLNSAAISSTKYVDNSVVAGDTYSYAVTAVDTSGVESSYSSTVSVTIP
jgi:fibronectin type 3 domain-containing protein